MPETKPSKDRSVLVTGATGFLGNVILAYLRKLGIRVTGTSRIDLSSISPPAVYIDLEDSAALQRLNAYGPFDTVVHCAAVLPGQLPDDDILLLNQRMTYNLLNWARISNVKSFYFLSSCNVYGNRGEPCTEDTLPIPDNCYAISKLACERLIQTFYPNGCSFRISAPYGPHLRTETVVKRFIVSASQGQPIPLMGRGSREQHFVYEEDVALAVALAIENNACGVFNVSGGSPVSMVELAKYVCKLFKLNPDRSIQFSNQDPQENYRGNFPFVAATKAFGYRPQVSLEQGLRLCASAWSML